MNIPGIPGSPYPSPVTVGRTITERRPQPTTVQAPDESVLPATRQATPPAPAPVPVLPPPGTDPTLWNVLNTEERAYFARVGAMGPLTYGRVLTGQMTAPTPDMRGGRLDMKV